MVIEIGQLRRLSTDQSAIPCFAGLGKTRDQLIKNFRFQSFSSDPNGPRPLVRLASLTPSAPPGGNPDFEQGALNANVVLRWEWRLGSLLYLVYTRSQVPNVSLGPGDVGALDLGALKRAPAADLFILKLSYWWG